MSEYEPLLLLKDAYINVQIQEQNALNPSLLVPFWELEDELELDAHLPVW